jgi:hypothetical protein
MKFRNGIAAFLLMSALVSSWACVKPFSTLPSAPAPGNPTPTFTNTFTPTFSPTTTPHITPTVPAVPPGGIFWAPCEIEGGSSFFQMAVNGAPESTSGVTLTTPSGPIPYTYYSAAGAYALYYATSIIPYVPGGSYTMTTVTSIGTAAATLIAPGGSVSMNASRTIATWAVEGNEDYITVGNAGSDYQSYLITTDLNSPATIPASAYPSLGTYYYDVVPQNTTYNITGAASGSRYTIKYMLSGTVIK